MTDDKHAKIHGWSSAENRYQHERAFFNAPIALFGGSFIMDGNYHRDNIDYYQIDI